MDAPTGLYLIWWEDYWHTVTAVDTANDYEKLLDEYERFNETHATELIAVIAGENTHIQDYGPGTDQLNLGVWHEEAMLPYRSRHARRYDADGIGYEGVSAYPSIIRYYRDKDILNHSDTMSFAVDALRKVVESVQDTHLYSQGLYGYHLDDESWDPGRDIVESYRVSALVESTITMIRERDQTRPIALSHSLSWLLNSDQDHLDFLDDVFSGDEMPGWNVFHNTNYPFLAPNTPGADVCNKCREWSPMASYAGDTLRQRMWEERHQ